MIDLTVKTLDSQNHLFSLDDDQITVRGFKEHIAECVEVPADSQRLIYCGRVLQDEKKLNDYDVNGKVIHLVQRAPPQPGQRGNDSGQGQGQSQGHGQGWQSQQRPHHYRLSRAQMHGNAMYLGAMSVPAEIVEGHGLPVPQLSNSLSNSRLIVARRMLHRANMLIDRLDNPTRAANSTTTENSQIPLQEDLEEIGAEDEDTSENRPNGGTRLAEAATAAAAIAATFSTVNVALLRSNTGDGIEMRVTSDGTEDNQMEGQGQQPQQQQQQEQQQQQQPQQPQQSQTDQQGVGTNTDSQPNRRIGQQLPRPFQMADLLAGVLHTQARLRPYLEHYYRLMVGDPVLQSGTGPGTIEESQRVVDGVSECLHCLAHACHALSDIIVDMNQHPPRNLRCRPIIIQHSAILQAGIPIQVEAHISLHGRNANNNNVNGETNDPANPQATSESADSSEPHEANNENANRQDTSNPAPGQESQQQQQQQQPQQQPEQTQSPFGTVFNLPNSVEVLMELNPESNVDAGAGSGAQQSAENNNNNYNAGGRIGGNGSGPSVLPWGSTPAPEFLRNLMQAVAGHMVQSSIATTNMTVRNPPVTGQQTVASSVDGTTTNAGQSTQARSNVGTHPTTATQTRSTSRPHVFHQHTHPLGVGMSMGQGFDLDPFLPCNSHHVRRTPSEPPSPATTATQPTHQNQASAQEPQSQPQPATSTSSNATSTNAAPPTTSQGTANAPLLSLEIRDTDFVQMGNIIRMLNGEGNQGGVMEDGSGSITVQEGITLADLLQTGGSLLRYAATDRSCEQAFLYSVASFVARSITLEDLLRLRLGQWEPIAQLRRSLRTFLEAGFTNTSCTEDIRDQVTERLFSQVKPFLECFLESERDIITRTDSRIDLCSTLQALLLVHGRNALRILFDNDIDDAHFGQEILTIVNNLGTQLCAVLRYSIRGGQASLEAVALRFVGGVLGGVNYLLREWMLTGFIARFRAYSSRIVQPPEAEIIPLLKYESTATPKSPPTGKQDSPQQSEDELMETDVDLKPNNEAPMLEDGEEIPETFPGHETLPSDWVPLIARDGVRQRRQLQMQEVANGGVATFSDAYLGGLPSKRRKLIEQQKPRLLVSPTPNHSAITASVERLVRDSVGRAGVEEVDGATVAVAADPGVRRAFGQAIRDCLNPRRYGTADFPDPLRFPNATRYFADQERPAK